MRHPNDPRSRSHTVSSPTRKDLPMSSCHPKEPPGSSPCRLVSPEFPPWPASRFPPPSLSSLAPPRWCRRRPGNAGCSASTSSTEKSCGVRCERPNNGSPRVERALLRIGARGENFPMTGARFWTRPGPSTGRGLSFMSAAVSRGPL